MDLLSKSTPLPWKDIREKADHVRKHGIKQFINQYQKSKDRQNDDFYWGDEVEYMLVKFDHNKKICQLLLKGSELLKILQQPEIQFPGNSTGLWRPEYGAFMLESSPGKPFSSQWSDFSFVEVNMNFRRKEVKELLGSDEALLTLSSFPRYDQNFSEKQYTLMEKGSELDLNKVLSPKCLYHYEEERPKTGCPNFMYPPRIHKYNSEQSLSDSLFFPDEDLQISCPRSRMITESTKERRKDKLTINIPIFKDKNTLSPFVEDFSQNGDDGQSQRLAKPDHIFMDAVGFGCGCCCLQTTVQASDIQEAFIIYDNLAPLCPIMLALSAAAPIFRGYLADSDCRWSVIAQSSDDRTEEERGIKRFQVVNLQSDSEQRFQVVNFQSDSEQRFQVVNLQSDSEQRFQVVNLQSDSEQRFQVVNLQSDSEQPLKNDRFLINKSRFDSVDSYLSEMGRSYNDLDLVYDKEIFEQLRDADVDDLLARHIAHLFIRDPLYILPEKIHQNDSEDTGHFDNIQSTNWQTLRFKPPPPNSNIGWRVEFRPMEVQLSDFENAAYAVFIVLVTRVILTFKLNFLIPISKVDENMVTADKKDAVREEKFYFRKDVITANSPEVVEHFGFSEVIKQIDEEYTLMSINEIINGKGDFPGLIPLVKKYLEYSECDVDTRCTVLQYLQLISDRASGKLMTMAQWIRKFVLTHADYKQDSVVNENITYDLLVECEKIASGEKPCPELFYKYSTHTRDNIPAAVFKAEANLNGKISAST